MTKKNEITISLDAMGGDSAPLSVIKGADLFLKQFPNVHYRIYGQEKLVKPLIDKFPAVKENSVFIHTDSYVASDTKPSIALRQGKNSSMRLALDSVKNNEANAAVSSGNTGALMAMAKLVLRPLPGIDRPAITTLIPTRVGFSVFLDLGANIDCNADNLVQFAIMGDAFAKVVLKIDSPKIGLLNVGTEDIKGSEIVKSAAEELREGGYPINFHGFIEGDDIVKGTTDVIVTDGFTGNIALKVAEGTASIFVDSLKKSFKSSILAMIGGMLARKSIKKAFNNLDPKNHNGAMFLGLNGIAIKSHGSSDENAFANAIKVAYNIAISDINSKIIQELSAYDNGEEEFDEEEL